MTLLCACTGDMHCVTDIKTSPVQSHRNVFTASDAVNKEKCGMTMSIAQRHFVAFYRFLDEQQSSSLKTI